MPVDVGVGHVDVVRRIPAPDHLTRRIQLDDVIVDDGRLRGQTPRGEIDALAGDGRAVTGDGFDAEIVPIGQKLEVMRVQYRRAPADGGFDLAVQADQLERAGRRPPGDGRRVEEFGVVGLELRWRSDSGVPPHRHSIGVEGDGVVGQCQQIPRCRRVSRDGRRIRREVTGETSYVVRVAAGGHLNRLVGHQRHVDADGGRIHLAAHRHRSRTLCHQVSGRPGGAPDCVVGDLGVEGRNHGRARRHGEGFHCRPGTSGPRGKKGERSDQQQCRGQQLPRSPTSTSVQRLPPTMAPGGLSPCQTGATWRHPFL